MYRNTAAVIIISEQILSGKKDFNSYTTLPLSLAPRWNITKLIVIPPIPQLVKCELKRAFVMCEIVIVLQEIANADLNVCDVLAVLFNEDMSTSRSLENVCTPVKCLTVENGAKNVSAPVISFHRIFVLQGDTSTITSAFDILKSYLNDYRKSLKYKKRFVIPRNEDTFEQFLREVRVNDIEVKVETLSDRYVVTAEAPKLTKVMNLEGRITERFGCANVAHRSDDLNIFDSFYFKVDPHIPQTIKIIEECYEKYGPKNVFISFNGGKDCTVLLHLALAVLQRKYPNTRHVPLCMYVRSEFAFPEQDDFILECQCYYNLQVVATHNNIKEGLETVLEKNPHLKACLMGTRRTDPYSNNLQTFQMTDPDWPQVMRVSPLLDWHYSYIWDYLLYFRVPYCTLYDEGYTSLGNMKNTVRNTCLRAYDVFQEQEVYLPACKLMDAKKERNGRN